VRVWLPIYVATRTNGRKIRGKAGLDLLHKLQFFTAHAAQKPNSK